ncbi:MAG: hypothetical protein M3R02_27670 [Chloroflexota bacterium]|nr:hypothetical protein [Chloroflexota bacterium]
MAAREGAPAEHRRQLERGKPDPDLPCLKVHCTACNAVVSVLQVERGQFISYWDGYRWFGLAAFCRPHGGLALDFKQAMREIQALNRKHGLVGHWWVPPASP